MSSLYRRATPSQARILRAVEGACLNVAHVHPNWQMTPRMARSIAKRAAGTLTAQWPDVLAARSRSSERSSGAYTNHARWPSHAAQTLKRSGWGASNVDRRSPLPALWRQLARMVGTAKRTGHAERAETLIEVLKLIASMQTPPPIRS